MKKISIAILLAFVLLVPTVAVNAAVVSVDELKNRVEKKHSIKIIANKGDSNYSDENLIRFIYAVDEALSMIPPEVNSAATTYFRNRGTPLTIRIPLDAKLTGGSDTLGTYDSSSGVITLLQHFSFMSDDDTGSMGAPSVITVIHEYGHAMHDMLNKKYGAQKLSNEWLALNNGESYTGAGGNYNNNREIFVTGYSGTLLEEDIAETFTFFTACSAARARYGIDNSKNYWKKGMLLEKAIKQSLSVSRAYYPTAYMPQKFSSWVPDSVVGFGVKYDEKDWHNDYIIRSSDDTIGGYYLYQEKISRIDFCEMLIDRINDVCKEKYGKGNGMEVDSGIAHENEIYLNGGLINLKTGEEADSPVVFNGKKIYLYKDPFLDTSSSYVFFANYYNIMSGLNEQEFGPTEKITREQAASIMARTYKELGIPDKGGNAPTFTDSSEISSWAKADVDFAVRNGIMTGIGGGTFSPKEAFSREQAFVVVCQMYEAATQ